MKANTSSIKRRRLLLLFWGSILLCSVLIVGEAFSTSTMYYNTETSELPQEAEYQGAELCKDCHPDRHNAWTGTGHAGASTASPGRTDNATYSEGACYSCHTNSTIGTEFFEVTATNTPVDQGVACETCHGPFQAPPGVGHMPSTLSAEFCGECHSPFHEWGHGNAYEAWSQSSHSHAQETLLELPFEQPQCIHCHSAEGALPWPLLGVETLAETENSITCPVCHDPHSAEHEHNLREVESTELCAVCHEHQTETFEGGPHELRGAECVTCHMFGWAQDYRGEWTQVTNHTMFTWQGACGQEGCHDDPEAAWAGKAEIQEDYAVIYAQGDEKVKAAQAAFEEANATAGADPEILTRAGDLLTEIEEFWHDIGLMGSQGFHNPEKMSAAIDKLILDCDQVIQLSEEATMPPVTSEPSLQFLTVLGIGIALLIAALRRRRVT